MKKTELTVKFGQTVRRLREQQLLSQEDFADLCGVHRTYIGAVERGEKSISVEAAKRIATALHMSLWSLLKQVEENNASAL